MKPSELPGDVARRIVGNQAEEKKPVRSPLVLQVVAQGNHGHSDRAGETASCTSDLTNTRFMPAGFSTDIGG